MTSLTATITSPVEIHKGSKNSKSIKLSLAEYPEFSFDLDGVAYSSTDKKAFINDHETGDKINVLITTEIYEKKLTKERDLAFWDKTNNYKFISIYGLKDDNRAYLTLDTYNKAKLSDSKLGVWFSLIISVFIFGAGIYTLREWQKLKRKDAHML